MSALVIPSDRARPKQMDREDRVFRHQRRPDWGLGVWVREERSRRRLRFEDGELRAFKKGFPKVAKNIWLMLLSEYDTDHEKDQPRADAIRTVHAVMVICIPPAPGPYRSPHARRTPDGTAHRGS